MAFKHLDSLDIYYIIFFFFFFVLIFFFFRFMGLWVSGGFVLFLPLKMVFCSITLLSHLLLSTTTNFVIVGFGFSVSIGVFSVLILSATL